jgi:hypothetical protein
MGVCASTREPAQIDLRDIHAAKDRVDEEHLPRILPGGAALEARIEVDHVLLTVEPFDRPPVLQNPHFAPITQFTSCFRSKTGFSQTGAIRGILSSGVGTSPRISVR